MIGSLSPGDAMTGAPQTVPLKDTKLAAFSVSPKPFFEYRTAIGRPSFADRKVPGGWQLCCQTPGTKGRIEGELDIQSVVELAEAIEGCGRSKTGVVAVSSHKMICLDSVAV